MAEQDGRVGVQDDGNISVAPPEVAAPLVTDEAREVLRQVKDGHRGELFDLPDLVDEPDA